MSKQRSIIFLLTSILFMGTVPHANAVQIPDYIEDVEDIKGNVNVIIENLTSKAVNSESAAEDGEFKNIILRQLAASLYAEALTTRTNILKAEKAKASKEKVEGGLGKLTGGADNKKDMMADEVQPQLRSIAERLTSIVSLEAGIANLEGTTIITRLPKAPTDLEHTEKEDEE